MSAIGEQGERHDRPVVAVLDRRKRRLTTDGGCPRARCHYVGRYICATVPFGKVVELTNLKVRGMERPENSASPFPSATGCTSRAYWSTSPRATRLRAKPAPPCATIGLPSRDLSFRISSARSPLATYAWLQLSPPGWSCALGWGPALAQASLSAAVVSGAFSTTVPRREKTALGIWFIGGANTPVEVGQ